MLPVGMLPLFQKGVDSIGLAVSKAVEVGNKNNITCTVRNYADSVVQLAGQAPKRFQDRIGGWSFRSVKKSIQRLEEAAMSCRGLQRLEILRRWVLLLKEVERLKLSQGSATIPVTANLEVGLKQLLITSGEFIESQRAQFWPDSVKLGSNWPLSPNPLACVTQRQGPLSLSQQKHLFHA